MLKVLIVDDSRIFRSLIENALTGEKDIQVVGSVWNGVKAMEFIRQHRPDLVTLDVEMPEMDGLETLRAIEEYNDSRPDGQTVGVLMVSALTKRGAKVTIDALELGAFDFVTKPEESGESNTEKIKRDLMLKIRMYAMRSRSGVHFSPTGTMIVPSRQPAPSSPPTPTLAPPVAVRAKETTVKAIVIGVSTGGPRALVTLMPALCEATDLPIFLVQHLPAGFTATLAENLAKRCGHSVIEAQGGEVVQPKMVYVAPGGKHLVLRSTGGQVITGLNEQPPENGCRPSVDVLFRSAAAVYGGDLVAVVLTGMGSDGTRGLGPVKRAGGYVVVQDEATSVVWGMPRSVAEAGLADEVVALEKIATAVKTAIDKRTK